MVEPAVDVDAAPPGLPLAPDYAGEHHSAVKKAISADGTAIAYEVTGTGPAVVVIGGGLNDRVMFTPFVTMMSEHFTIYNYDRRGRGDSDYGDPDNYTIQREVEDLAAVIEAADEPCSVFANCTGAIIAIHAAAAGVPMEKLGMYEPPYSYPSITPDQMRRLRELIAEGRREETVILFGTEVVGFLSPDTVESFKKHPVWQAFISMAPSCVYDAVISEQHSTIPFHLLPQVRVPTLILSGCESPLPIQEACQTLADEIPDAKLIRLEGEGHLLNQQVGTPLFAQFLQS